MIGLNGQEKMNEPAENYDPRYLAGILFFNEHDYFEAHKGGLPPSGLYDRVLREVERPLITLSLGATHGNQVKAAQLLGLNRNTLRKKIRELDIEVSRGLK